MPDVHCLIGNSRKILENHRYGPIPNWKPLHSLCLEPLPVAPYQLQGLRQSRGGFRRARLCRSDDNCRNRRCYRGQSSIPNLSQFPTILPPSWKKDRKVFFTSKAPRVTGIPQAVQRCPKDFWFLAHAKESKEASSVALFWIGSRLGHPENRWYQSLWVASSPGTSQKLIEAYWSQSSLS